MNKLLANMRRSWADMFTAPWHLRDQDVSQLSGATVDASDEARIRRQAQDRTSRTGQWLSWLIGWAWALCGLVGGALIAPSLVQWTGLSGLPYRDWFIIGIAALAGFLVHALGWILITIYISATTLLLRIAKAIGIIRLSMSMLLKMAKPAGIALLLLAAAMAIFWVATLVATVLLPVVGVGYGLYRYFTWVGPNQRAITMAFVGALLIKTFAIPLIKGIVTGALFKWFLKWLRGGRDIPQR